MDQKQRNKISRICLAKWLWGLFNRPIKYGGLKKYIQNQQEHHRKQTFEDEYRLFLRKYQIPFDEKYVWD